MALTYEPIATTTLPSDNSLSFTSIPSTFTDLRLVITGAGSAPRLRFNGNSTTSYSFTYMASAGSAISGSTGATNGTVSTWAAGYPQSADSPSLLIVDIFDYAGSTYKTLLQTHGTDQNGSGEVNRSVAMWKNTAAITSISTIGSLFAGSRATLYGIKRA